MKWKNIFLIIVVGTLLCTSIYSQNAPTYYGYWPSYLFFEDQASGANTMKSNCGEIDTYQYFYDAAKNYSNKKYLVDITSFFWEDNDGNNRPDIEDIKSDGSWDTNLNILDNTLKKKTGNSDLTVTQFQSLIGFAIEEPIGRGSESIDIGDDFSSSAMNYEYLKFVVKGRFCNVSASNGTSKLDDIALVYNDSSGGMNIQIMKSNIDGKGMTKLAPWITKPLPNYSINSVKFAVSGNFSNHTDGMEDLALFYQYPDHFTIQLFTSTGTGFTSNDYWTIFSSGSLDISLIKYVTSGNYDNVLGDEIAIFYRTPSNSYIYVIKPNGNITVWRNQPNSLWDINSIRGVATGNFNGIGTDEIAALYDYPASSQGRIEVFTTNSSYNGFNNYWDWMTKSYSEINFNKVKGFFSGDFNYDKNDDLALIYNGDDYCKIIKLKSVPTNSKFEDCWISKRNWVNKLSNYVNQGYMKTQGTYGDFMYFDHMPFACVGNFYENTSSDPRNWFNDYKMEQLNGTDRIDDVMLFYDHSLSDPAGEINLICDATTPLIGFSDKNQLEVVASRLQVKYPSVKRVVLYQETDTYMPSNIFPSNYDWYGVDPYPFIKKNGLADPNQYPNERIDVSVQNLLDKNPTKKVFIVGLAAEAVGVDGERYPTNTEVDYYFTKSKSNSRIIGLFWWAYKNYPGQWNGTKDNSTLRTKHTAIGNEIDLVHSLSKQVTKEPKSETVPIEFGLSQNYPNPFNPTTLIKYSILKSSFVTLNVYDVLGNEVKTLVNEFKSPGVYELTFNGENLSSGTYFYRITAGNFTETKKFILMK